MGDLLVERQSLALRSKDKCDSTSLSISCSNSKEVKETHIRLPGMKEWFILIVFNLFW
jgi:hypothetical protein